MAKGGKNYPPVYLKLYNSGTARDKKMRFVEFSWKWMTYKMGKNFWEYLRPIFIYGGQKSTFQYSKYHIFFVLEIRVF